MRSRAVIALAATCSAAGCQLMVALEGKNRVHASPDATTVTTNDAADVGTVSSLCGKRPAPRNDAASFVAEQQKFFVIRKRLRLEGIAGGFDLDCVDTCGPSQGGGACAPHSDAALCDEDGGIDNQLVAVTRRSNFDIGSMYEANVVNGTAGILLGISRYSGDETDNDVYLSILLSGGVVGHDCDAAGAPDADPDVSIGAAFDGCDLFAGDPRFVAGGSLKHEPVAAQVVGRTLLVNRPFHFWLSLGSRFIEVEASHFEAAFDQGDGGLVLRGNIGGIAAPERLLRALAEQSLDPKSTAPICNDSLVWPVARQRLCDARDMPGPTLPPRFDEDAGADASIDGAPESGAADGGCDGISFGFQFEAWPVRLAPVAKGVTRLDDQCTLAQSEYRCE